MNMSPPGGAVVNVKCVKVRDIGVCSIPCTLALQGLILSTFALLVVNGGCTDILA